LELKRQHGEEMTGEAEKLLRGADWFTDSPQPLAGSEVGFAQPAAVAAS
jgi:hypothetical protein